MINRDMTPACRAILDRLELFLDDELPAAERAEIALHLSGCASCRAEWCLLTVISNAVRSRSRPGPSERFRVRLTEEVKRDAGGGSPSMRQIRRIVYEPGSGRVVRFESPVLNRYRPASTIRHRQGAYRSVEYREAAPGGSRMVRTVRTG